MPNSETGAREAMLGTTNSETGEEEAMLGNILPTVKRVIGRYSWVYTTNSETGVREAGIPQGVYTSGC